MPARAPIARIMGASVLAARVLTTAALALGAATGAHAQDAQDARDGGPPTTTEPLSRAAFIAQMDVEFKRLDGDGNGMVTPEEIVASQQAAAQAEALRQNRIIFERIDTDGDNLLTPEEFAALANPSAIPVDATPLMTQFDTDRDGIITVVEYRIATQANFDRVDSDRDGVATDSEMRAAGIR